MEIRLEDIEELTTEQLLYVLKCRIVEPEMVTVEVMPSIIIEVKREDLRQWCINRIMSQQKHKNKCITSSGPSKSDLRKMLRTM